MIRALLAAVLLCACAPRTVHLPDDQRAVVDATLAGWREAGLPDPGACLDRFTVRWAESRDEFARTCAREYALPYLPEVVEAYGLDRAAACLVWRQEDRGIVGYAHPMALLAPGQLLVDGTGGPVIHEALHALVYCAGLSPRDRYDHGHTLERVWSAAGGEASAQSRARRKLREERGDGAR